MKLTDNQKVIVSTLLKSYAPEVIVSWWDFKKDRETVSQEILRLYKTFHIPISKERVSALSKAVERGKDNASN